MKLLGGMLIFTGAVFLLLEQRRRQRREQQLCRQLTEKLRRIEQEALRFSRPLPPLFRDFSRAEDLTAPFFHTLWQSLTAEPEVSLPCHWGRALASLPPPLQQRLEPVGRGLEGDEERLQQTLILAAEALEDYRRQWQQKQQQRQQMETTLYLSAAALLVILLL